MKIPRKIQFVMKASRSGVCADTGAKISVGDSMLYRMKSKHSKALVFCTESESYKEAVDLSSEISKVTGYKN